MEGVGYILIMYIYSGLRCGLQTDVANGKFSHSKGQVITGTAEEAKVSGLTEGETEEIRGPREWAETKVVTTSLCIDRACSGNHVNLSHNHSRWNCCPGEIT